MEHDKEITGKTLRTMQKAIVNKDYSKLTSHPCYQHGILHAKEVIDTINSNIDKVDIYHRISVRNVEKHLDYYDGPHELSSVCSGTGYAIWYKAHSNYLENKFIKIIKCSQSSSSSFRLYNTCTYQLPE